MPVVDPGPELVALIALVAGITEAIKRLAFPAAWQYGRAPMLLAAVLAIAAVLLGSAPAQLTGETLLALATAWLAVYTGAIGAHQTLTKAARVATGSTNPAGPDGGT